MTHQYMPKIFHGLHKSPLAPPPTYLMYSPYYQRNWGVILDRAKDYYENDKERLRGQARDKYRNLSEEEKNKKREYGGE